MTIPQGQGQSAVSLLTILLPASAESLALNEWRMNASPGGEALVGESFSYSVPGRRAGGTEGLCTGEGWGSLGMEVLGRKMASGV